MKLVTFIFASLVLMSSSAFAECVFTNSIDGFRVEGRDLILEAGRDEYVADVGVCPQLDWADSIGFDTFSSFQVCDGDHVLIYDFNRVVDRCTIWSLERR